MSTPDQQLREQSCTCYVADIVHANDCPRALTPEAGLIRAALDLHAGWKHAAGCKCLKYEAAFDAAIDRFRKARFND